jgi:hypothetical protein
MLEGYGKYVSDSTGIKITGENVLQFTIEEQKRYVLRDAELVIKLIERNNYETLNIMRCIADIAGLDFKQVCHVGVGKAWESIIYSMIQNGECHMPALYEPESPFFACTIALCIPKDEAATITKATNATVNFVLISP